MMNDSSKVKFKIWGMERSGTNYTQNLLQENIMDASVHASDGGRKHGVVSRGMYGTIPEGAINIVVTKHPMPWLVSFKDYYQDEYTVKGALRLYAVTLDYWLQALPLESERAFVLRYEDLIDNPKDEILDIICEVEGALPSETFFTDINEICGPGSGTHGGPPKPAFDRNKYVEERWRDELPRYDYEANINWCDKWGFTEVFQEVDYNPFEYNFDHEANHD